MPAFPNVAGLSVSKIPSAAVMTESLASPQLSIVVPVFNEEENISILQSELGMALAGTDHEIVFVDDGSTDQTGARISPSSNVRLIRFEQNRGQSAAIYAGAQAARGDVVVFIDGDLQNDPADILRLTAEIAR